MHKITHTTLPSGSKATVVFLSRFDGEDDYRVTLANGTTGRVRHTKQNDILAIGSEIGQQDAEAAVAAWEYDSEMEFLEWNRKNPDLVIEE